MNNYDKILLKSYENDFVKSKDILKTPKATSSMLGKYFKIATIDTSKPAGTSFLSLDSQSLFRFFFMNSKFEECLVGLNVKSRDTNFNNALYLNKTPSFFKVFLSYDSISKFSLYVKYNESIGQSIYIQPLLLGIGVQFNSNWVETNIVNTIPGILLPTIITI